MHALYLFFVAKITASTPSSRLINVGFDKPSDTVGEVLSHVAKIRASLSEVVATGTYTPWFETGLVGARVYQSASELTTTTTMATPETT
jgi:hypothetical protein